LPVVPGTGFGTGPCGPAPFPGIDLETGARNLRKLKPLASSPRDRQGHSLIVGGGDGAAEEALSAPLGQKPHGHLGASEALIVRRPGKGAIQTRGGHFELVAPREIAIEIDSILYGPTGSGAIPQGHSPVPLSMVDEDLNNYPAAARNPPQGYELEPGVA
jgi:hypothetical protein